jgi:hypothetical protein
MSTSAAVARADRYEATFTLRPLGTMASISEKGAPTAAKVEGAGGVLAFSYGARNWLDLGGELLVATFAQASYDNATVMVTTTPRTGLVTRTSRLGQARLGATFRLGVAWVPTVFVGLGIGARLRGDETLVSDSHGPLNIVPDGGAVSTSLDLTPTVRIGLERRLDRRWTLGLAAGGTYCIGIGAPAIAMADASISLAYTWYPLW